jgi:hypothetical protein
LLPLQSIVDIRHSCPVFLFRRQTAFIVSRVPVRR